MSGQKLGQILSPALLALHWFLSFQNQKFINLTALLTTVLINRHNPLLRVTDANILAAYVVMLLFRGSSV